MKLEKQVCALEYSKRLKELGVKQESCFRWIGNNEDDDWVVRSSSWHSYHRELSAFTVAELGKILETSGMDLPWPVDGKWWFNTMAEDGMLDTEADARASMLINLLESKTFNQPLG